VPHIFVFFWRIIDHLHQVDLCLSVTSTSISLSLLGALLRVISNFQNNTGHFFSFFQGSPFFYTRSLCLCGFEIHHSCISINMAYIKINIQFLLLGFHYYFCLFSNIFHGYIYIHLFFCNLSNHPYCFYMKLGFFVVDLIS